MKLTRWLTTRLKANRRADNGASPAAWRQTIPRWAEGVLLCLLMFWHLPAAGQTQTIEPPTPLSESFRAAKLNSDCESGTAKGGPCRVRWVEVGAESFVFLATQHGGNIVGDRDTRRNLTSGEFWSDYVYCVEHYRWSRWRDDDPFWVDYIGHPIMGSITNSIYEQNDPKQRALSFSNTHEYWMGRLRATAYSGFYSAQWKIGPASEASIGNTGIGYYFYKGTHIWTNGTGMQDFFVTPIGGLAWNVGEDAIDRFLFRRVRRKTHNKFVLAGISFLMPSRSAANVLRLRALYYRDEDLQTVPR